MDMTARRRCARPVAGASNARVGRATSREARRLTTAGVTLVLFIGVAAAALGPEPVIETPPTRPHPSRATAEPAKGNILGLDLDSLPASGAAWIAMATAANSDWGTPDISSSRDRDAVNVLAGALVAVRMNDAAMLAKVVAFLEDVQDTAPNSNDLLAAARKLGGYIVAADVIGYHDPAFEGWVTEVLDFEYTGGGSVRSVHERRPNNFGTHAFFARVAAAVYLEDAADLERAVYVYQAWIGEDTSPNRYSGFEWGSRRWQAGPSQPIGITLPGDENFANGGILPDDQRRGGRSWRCENYVREALQGVLAGNIVLAANGYPDVWEWGQSAIYRAVALLRDQGCAFLDDDAWQLWVIDHVYGTNWHLDGVPAPGKNFGWADWLFDS